MHQGLMLKNNRPGNGLPDGMIEILSVGLT